VFHHINITHKPQEGRRYFMTYSASCSNNSQSMDWVGMSHQTLIGVDGGVRSSSQEQQRDSPMLGSLTFWNHSAIKDCLLINNICGNA